MKRVVILFAIVFLLSLSAYAQQKIEIVYWTHEDPNRTEIENRYIEEFEAANPGVTIKRVTNPSNKMAEIVLTAFAANQGPDMFNLQIEDEYAYIVNNRLAPIDYKAAGYDSLEAVYQDYMPGTLDSVTFENNLYGLPMELTNWCIYLNKRVFWDAGLDPDKDYPKTWEEMVEVSEKIVIRDGEIITRRGFDFRYPYYLVAMVPMAEQLGGKLISDDGKTAIVNDEAWLKFLTFMQQWGPNGKNLGSPTYTPARNLFNKDNNDIAMCQSGLYQEGRIRNDNPEFYESGDWAVIPYPLFEDAVQDVAGAYYGHYFVVNQQKPKENQEMTWKFISYMLSHPEEYLIEVGLIQPKVSLMESDVFKNMPYSDVFKKDMERGHIVYYAENSAIIQQYIRDAVEAVMLTGGTPESALQVMKSKIQEVLEGD